MATKSMNQKRRPASKNSKISCAAMIGYGENIVEGKFGLKDVISGRKSSPLSTELTTGMTITVEDGGNPNKQVEER